MRPDPFVTFETVLGPIEKEIAEERRDEGAHE